MKKNTIIILVIIIVIALLIVVFGFSKGVFAPSTTDLTGLPQTTTTTTTTTTTMSNFSLVDVAKHNSTSDCWLVINKKVYDVSKYLGLDIHPAGSGAIIPYCGKDATVAFETRNKPTPQPHSGNAQNILNDYYIGDIKN